MGANGGAVRLRCAGVVRRVLDLETELFGHSIDPDGWWRFAGEENGFLRIFPTDRINQKRGGSVMKGDGGATEVRPFFRESDTEKGRGGERNNFYICHSVSYEPWYNLHCLSMTHIISTVKENHLKVLCEGFMGNLLAEMEYSIHKNIFISVDL